MGDDITTLTLKIHVYITDFAPFQSQIIIGQVFYTFRRLTNRLGKAAGATLSGHNGKADDNESWHNLRLKSGLNRKINIPALLLSLHAHGAGVMS